MDGNNQVTLSQVAAKTIAAYGAEYIFTVSGSPLNILYFCQAEENVKVVLGHSERSAMFMADGYARMTGKPTFGYVQFGVGGGSLPPVFAEAMWGQSPLVMLSGSTSANTRDRYEYQEVDQLPMIRPSAKWATGIAAPNRIADMLRNAVRASVSGVPGPSFLEIPANQFTAPVGGLDQAYAEPAFMKSGSQRMVPAPDDVDSIIKLLARAEKPVVIVGGECQVFGAYKELLDFAEATGILVASSPPGKASFPERHKQAIGVVGRYGRRATNEIVIDADFILAVGTQLSAMTTLNYKVPRQDAVVAHISVDPMTLGRTYREKVSIVADPVSAFASLAEAARAAKIDPKRWSSWRAKAAGITEAWREKYRQEAAKKAVNGKINTVHLMSVLDQHIADDDIIVADTGNATRWAGALYDCKQSGRLFQRAAGSLGWALPGGFGVQLAVKGKKRVYTIIGDGGMAYHIGDMESAVRLGLPAITIVLNNQAFNGYAGLLKRNLGFDAECPPELSKFRDVRFGDVAKAYDAYGERVEDPDQIVPALRRAEESGLPAILDVQVWPGAVAPGMGMESVL